MSSAAMFGYNQQQQAIALLREHIAKHNHSLPEGARSVDGLSKALMQIPEPAKQEFEPLAMAAARYYARTICASDISEIVVTSGSLVNRLTLVGVWAVIGTVIENVVARKQLDSLASCYGLRVEIK